MNKYLKSLNETTRRYFGILSEDFPEFLLDYIYTPEMQRISKISMSCGMDYTDLYRTAFFYSNLEHSVGVALIILHFTRDKKQTLAELFHDISNPAFKHCIDFLNGDPEKQESIEEYTTDILESSKEISRLLKRDKIKLEDVSDYKIYPIADNELPKLSADRLEYSFSTGFVQKPVWTLEEVGQVYNDIAIFKNEKGIDEVGFKSIKKAELFIDKVSQLWAIWKSNRNKIMMETYAEIFRLLGEQDLLKKEELYFLSEEEIIDKIKNCGVLKIEKAFENFSKANKILESEDPIPNKYCKSLKTKLRYIIPLVNYNGKISRVTDVSPKANKKIKNFLNYKTKKYVALDFEI